MVSNDKFKNQFIELVTSRRSTRAFLPTPVPDDVLQSLFKTANCAPSNCNTQPWQTYVLSGKSRDRMSKALKASVGQGELVMDFPENMNLYKGIYRERQIAIAKLLYGALEIARGDKQGRKAAFLRNLDFFDAPHVAFLFMPDWGSEREASDVGMYAQTLLLTMLAHGISSCPQTSLGYNADVVREQLVIDASQKLLFGISFGYKDGTKPENKIRPARASVQESTTFFD